MNVEALLRDNIKTIKAYSSARDEYQNASGDMVFIDANENPFDTSVNRYPDPQQTALKQRISEIKGIPVDQMLLGNGSDEVLDLIFRAFCEPNRDNILILPPTYGMYSVLADLNATDIIEVNLSRNFEPAVEEILECQNQNSKLLFICSPNNPTANSFEAERIEALIKGFKGIVIIDEAYIDFSEASSWSNRLSEFPNLIVTQTLSKAYGLAGIRLGICMASSYIITVLNKIKPPYNVNALSQAKALNRLEKLNEVETEVRTILNERERLKHGLNSVGFIKQLFPTDANFILARVDDADKRYKQLIAKGIVVRNRSSQPLCENCLRFTVGTPEDNSALLKALKEME